MEFLLSNQLYFTGVPAVSRRVLYSVFPTQPQNEEASEFLYFGNYCCKITIQNCKFSSEHMIISLLIYVVTMKFM